ncbi:MAG: hypothetical protein JXR79_01585 [Nitrospirae bacterium]|nr:hypothetical protein [Nitrospirota bacterium]
MMDRIKRIYIVVIVLLFGIYASSALADESEMFSSVAPDSLIVLDLSGSMAWTPAGGTATTTGLPCTATTCSRLNIAKTTLFNIFDSDNNSLIDSNDEKNLNIRIGYMRFYDCYADDTAGSYSSGCNQLVYGINTQYTKIYCNKSAPNTCLITDGSSPCVKTESASGGTPLGAALTEAKYYLDYHKSRDAAQACRPKFVIFITDGEDTYSCGGSGSTGSIGRRMTTVAKAKALADAGYKVFVIGFGSGMPASLKNTLNWAAYFGQTENPNTTNTGDTSAITIPAIPCSATTDPGAAALDGYAFMAENANELEAAIKQALAVISGSIYTFSTPAVAAIRTADENFLYEGSLTPNSVDPFWKGYLKQYEFGANNTLVLKWEAGQKLADTAASSRKIYTYKSAAVTEFNTTNISVSDLGVSTTAQRDMVVGYFRGDPTYNPENWKLGDIFHSGPTVVGTPNIYFSDIIDTSSPAAFSVYRDNNLRSTANGKRIVLVGANDGQLHAFKTSDGTETWSFIPPNLLSRLSQIAHDSHPTALMHTFYVDGPITQSDVWTGSGDGTTKQASDWRSFIVFGLGRGGDKTLWSSSASCDSGFNDKYTTTYTNYCGYYALDVTDTISAPLYKWKISSSASEAPYIGQPWSKMTIGKIKISDEERWVGIIGGGYNAAACNTGQQNCDTRGKGIFIIDMKTGSVLKAFTRANVSGMDFSMPSQAAAFDKDGDGFMDIIYIGDLGGNVWKVNMCGKNSPATCAASDWTISTLFAASSGVIRPIYNKPVIARDSASNYWVYWGTGDDTDPTAANAQEKFYAVMDTGITLTINDLENITTGTYNPSTSTKPGWYINLPGSGEKILTEPDIFGGVVYFTTYVPANGNDPCDMTGDSNLYGVNYITGAAALPGNTARSIDVGEGIKMPIITTGPTGNPRLITPGGTSTPGAVISDGGFDILGGMSNSRWLMYWKDKRLK